MEPGPTGDYPHGKLNEDDEGGLNIGIANDGKGNIIINFGKKVLWLGMPVKEAVDFALAILHHAGAEVTKVDRRQ